MTCEILHQCLLPSHRSEERSAFRCDQHNHLSRLRIFSRTGARTSTIVSCAHALPPHPNAISPHPPPLPKGYTSWPEDWNTSQETNGFLSKMHGCYNGIGLWFIEGLAGIAVDASADPPLSFRAAVEAGDITWASGARYVCGLPVYFLIVPS